MMKQYMKILTAAAVAATLSSGVFAATADKGLSDIDGYWGKAAIQYFYDNHYVSGSNGQFKPNDNITREGIAAIINNMLGADSAVTTSNFTDVKGRWSERAITSLVDKQIMNGYSDGKFYPTRQITREEFAVIAYNYLTFKGITPADGKAVSYNDESKISSWALPAVKSLAASGYMTGANNTFNPKAFVTRGEAVNVLYRIVTGLKQTPAQQQATTQATSQNDVQTQVFKDIKDTYGSIQSFAKDGVMYWQGNTLHVGVKDAKNKTKLATALANDTTIPADAVTVQSATYSYDDYKNMMAQAEKLYKATEGANATVKTEVDYLNEKVVLTVSSISKDTQANLNKALGGALRIVIQ